VYSIRSESDWRVGSAGFANSVVLGRPSMTEFLHDAGILMELIGRPGISGVARVALHEGLSLRPAGRHTVFVDAQSTSTLWCAFYGEAILRNHWEPFDQSSVAAYMPLAYDNFDRIALEGSGEFLVQRGVRAEPLRGTVVDDGHTRLCRFLAPGRWADVRTRLEQFLLLVRVPTTLVDACAATVLERLQIERSQHRAA